MTTINVNGLISHFKKLLSGYIFKKIAIDHSQDIYLKHNDIEKWKHKNHQKAIPGKY